jgi:hypothetical protein
MITISLIACELFRSWRYYVQSSPVPRPVHPGVDQPAGGAWRLPLPRPACLKQRKRESLYVPYSLSASGPSPPPSTSSLLPEDSFCASSPAGSGMRLPTWTEGKGGGEESGGGRSGRRGCGTAVSTHARIHGVRRRRGGLGNGSLAFVFFLCLSPLLFPWCAIHLLGTGLGGGQREPCNVPPSGGQRRGNGLKCTPL